MPFDEGFGASDFAVRARPSELLELMDGESSYEDFRKCLRDLGRVNTVTLAYGPTLEFLDRVSDGRDPDVPLHILDVGSGGGDGLRRIARWAKRRGRRVRLSGVDSNAHAAQAAHQLSRGRDTNIQWITADVFNFHSEQPVDIVLSALFTHHLEDAEIARFLAWSEATARVGWFVNDLYRSADAAMAFRVLARFAHWHRFVQHDGPVSVRRAFREEDWQQLCVAAGLDPSTVVIQKWFPARLCVERVK